MKNKRITVRFDSELLDDFLHSMKVMQDGDMSKVIRKLITGYVNTALKRVDEIQVIREYHELNQVVALGGKLSEAQQQKLESLAKLVRKFMESYSNG